MPSAFGCICVVYGQDNYSCVRSPSILWGSNLHSIWISSQIDRNAHARCPDAMRRCDNMRAHKLHTVHNAVAVDVVVVYNAVLCRGGDVLLFSCPTRTFSKPSTTVGVNQTLYKSIKHTYKLFSQLRRTMYTHTPANSLLTSAPLHSRTPAAMVA